MRCSQGVRGPLLCQLLSDCLLPAAKPVPASCCNSKILHSAGQHICLQALKIHESTGLAVLVPDLYHGKLGVDAEEATHVRDASAVACCVLLCCGQPTVVTCQQPAGVAAIIQLCCILLSCCIMPASCGRRQQLEL